MTIFLKRATLYSSWWICLLQQAFWNNQVGRLVVWLLIACKCGVGSGGGNLARPLLKHRHASLSLCCLDLEEILHTSCTA